MKNESKKGYAIRLQAKNSKKKSPLSRSSYQLLGAGDNSDSGLHAPPRANAHANVFAATLANFDWVTEIEPDPTDELPGTPAKVNVMRARLERGEDLHHPDDKNSYAGCSGDLIRSLGGIE